LATFGAWCDVQTLINPRRKIYGISLDNPMLTQPKDCRYDLAIEVDATFGVNEADQASVAIQQFGGGHYASHPFKGTATQIGVAWRG
jgi:AraC family transcriptional regulator